MRMRELLSLKKKTQDKIEYIKKNELKLLRDELEDINKMIKSQCKHPKKFVETKYYTIPGGYYNKCEYHKWIECSQCGAKSEVEITDGGYG